MESETGFSMDEFSTELGDFQVKKVGKFERLWNIGYGGSIDQDLLVHDGVLYFGCFDHNVYAISAADGRLIWKFETRRSIGESSPVLYNNTIYIGSYDYNVYALDARTGQLRWKFKTQGEIGSTVSISNGIVYFGSRDQLVYALRADDGSLVWKFKTNDAIISQPTVYEGMVFIGSFDHNVYCLDAMTGRLIRKFETQQEVYNANPFLIHHGVIYFGSFDNSLRAVKIEDGRELWKFNLGIYGTAASPILHDDVLYQETRDGSLIALTLEGKEKWRFKTKETLALPHIHEGRIYVGSADFNCYCLSLEGGRVLWKFTTQGPTWWDPAFWKDTVYFSSWDCHIYALDKNTGKEAWRFNTGSGPSHLPPISEGYEVVLRIPKSEMREDARKKQYELNLAEEEDGTSAYKSRITYQISTQYAAKGKYQIDSDEEEF